MQVEKYEDREGRRRRGFEVVTRRVQFLLGRNRQNEPHNAGKPRQETKQSVSDFTPRDFNVAQEVLLVGLSPRDYDDQQGHIKTVSRVQDKLHQLKRELASLKQKGEKRIMPTGTIKNIVDTRGFGFIAPVGEGEEDVFFHLSALEGYS